MVHEYGEKAHVQASPGRGGRSSNNRNQPGRFQAKGRGSGAARSAVEAPKHDSAKCKDVCSTAAETIAMPLAIDSFFEDEYTSVNYVNGTSDANCSAEKPLWRMILEPFWGG